LTPKPLAADRAEQVRPVPTLVVPAGQENGFIGIKETPITIMPGLPFGKRRALEIALHGAPTDANLLRDGIQGPALLMRRPDLVIMGPPPGAPLARLSRGDRVWMRGEPRSMKYPGEHALVYVAPRHFDVLKRRKVHE
jgi:hypothetical protein